MPPSKAEGISTTAEHIPKSNQPVPYINHPAESLVKLYQVNTLNEHLCRMDTLGECYNYWPSLSSWVKRT